MHDLLCGGRNGDIGSLQALLGRTIPFCEIEDETGIVGDLRMLSQEHYSKG